MEQELLEEHVKQLGMMVLQSVHTNSRSLSISPSHWRIELGEHG
jgi:hypothetical protein